MIRKASKDDIRMHARYGQKITVAGNLPVIVKSTMTTVSNFTKP